MNNNRLIQKDKFVKNKCKERSSRDNSLSHKPHINKKLIKHSSRSHSRKSVEDRLFSKKKEYDLRRKEKTEMLIKNQKKECTFVPKLEKTHARSSYSNGTSNYQNSTSEISYNNFVGDETDKRMKEDRSKIAKQITKGYRPITEMHTPKEILHRQTSSDKAPSNRYESDEAVEDSNIQEFSDDPKQEVSQDVLQEESSQEQDHMSEYLAKKQFDLPQEEKDNFTSEVDQVLQDEEQSGSDVKEDIQDSSPNSSPEPELDQEPEIEPEEQEEIEGEGEGDNFPILFLDVNLGKDKVERLVIYDGDDPYAVADEFCARYALEDKKKRKLAKVIKKQLDSLLTRIDEDEDEEDSRD